MSNLDVVVLNSEQAKELQRNVNDLIANDPHKFNAFMESNEFPLNNFLLILTTKKI